MSAKDRIKLIALAKAHIDKGFSRVGRTLREGDPADAALTGLAGRALALSDAVALLALRDHAAEALPLLRELLEVAVAMRWIAAEGGAEHARRYAKEVDDQSWESLWSARRLAERSAGLGLDEALVARIQASWREHRRGKAGALPWGHRVAGEPSDLDPEAVVCDAARVMGEAVKALNERWGEFPGAEDLIHQPQAKKGV